jgi:hypothetical protein
MTKDDYERLYQKSVARSPNAIFDILPVFFFEKINQDK